MCKFVSGYLTKLGDIYDGAGFTDSHSEIARIHNLRDGEVEHYSQNLAKWECTPPEDTKLWQDFSKWTVRYDGDDHAPDWFDAEKIRAHVAKLVAPWFVTDKRGVLLGGCWIFDGENACAKRLLQCRVVAVINGANLDGANLTRADMTRAYLDGAKMAGAYLTGADMTDADLDGANLTRADMTRADMTGAHLTGADMTGAYLDGANLTRADMTRADMTGAHLARANLDGAKMDGAYLTGADMTGAKIDDGVPLPKGWKLNASGIVVKDAS